MEIILREDVPELGIIGEIVNVKPGYARNYLFPRGLAVPANRRNVRELEHHQRLIEIKKERERGTYERLAESLSALTLETEVRAGRGGKLFGSITNIDVHALLEQKGFEIDRRRIDLKTPIKEIGDHQVPIRVGQDITTEVKLVIKPVGGELEDKSPDGEDEAHSAEAAPAAQDTTDASAASAEDTAAEPTDAGSQTGEGDSVDAETADGDSSADEEAAGEGGVASDTDEETDSARAGDDD